MNHRIKKSECSEKLININIGITMSESSMYVLAQQKQTLLKLAHTATKIQEDHLTGLIHLIDHIQDEMEKSGAFREKCIFPFR